MNHRAISWIIMMAFCTAFLLGGYRADDWHTKMAYYTIGTACILVPILSFIEYVGRKIW